LNGGVALHRSQRARHQGDKKQNRRMAELEFPVSSNGREV
jgi:hypothetical protein